MSLLTPCQSVPHNTQVSSDIYFNVVSWFPGNVSVKPHFNTQCPPPLKNADVLNGRSLYQFRPLDAAQHHAKHHVHLYVFLGGFLSILINVNFNRKGVSYSIVLTWDKTSDNDWMWILTIRVEKFQICIMMKNA